MISTDWRESGDLRIPREGIGSPACLRGRTMWKPETFEVFEITGAGIWKCCGFVRKWQILFRPSFICTKTFLWTVGSHSLLERRTLQWLSDDRVPKIVESRIPILYYSISCLQQDSEAFGIVIGPYEARGWSSLIRIASTMKVGPEGNHLICYCLLLRREGIRKEQDRVVKYIRHLGSWKRLFFRVNI